MVMLNGLAVLDCCWDEVDLLPHAELELKDVGLINELILLDGWIRILATLSLRLLCKPIDSKTGMLFSS